MKFNEASCGNFQKLKNNVMNEKKKKQKHVPRDVESRDVERQRYTDRGTVYDDDEFQEYPEFTEEEGIPKQADEPGSDAPAKDNDQ